MELHDIEQCACAYDPCICEIDKSLLADFRAAATHLDAVMKRVNKKHPRACLYLDGTGNVALLSGPSHVGKDTHARRDRIMASVNVRSFGGGDW